MVFQNSLSTKLLPQNLVNYTIILPKSYTKTCYWLHGYQERAADILAKSNFEQLAETYGIAIILPDLPDTYYLNQPWNHCYTEKFFMEEFVPAISSQYRLPSSKEDVSVGGISMGGFGSLLIGSHAPTLFGKIICISGAFILDDILIGNPEVIGNFQGNLQHFQDLFGELWSLDESLERNPRLAAQNALEKGTLPEIFMACGTEDMLYSRNIKLRDYLIKSGAEISWYESTGIHNWHYFQKASEYGFRCLI